MRDLVRRISTAAVALTALMITPAVAQQAAWPTRPLTLIVPFAAGGSADIIARAMADHTSAAIGQSIIVENRGGAGGNVGAAVVAKAAPDGYTLLFGSTGPAATNTLMYKNLSFDSRRDFTPIVLVGKTPVIIVARLNAPVASLKELIAYAKANPGQLTAGFPGNGTLGHITGVLLSQHAGIDIKHVQYRGGGAIINDLLGGHIDIGMDAMTPYVAQVQDGKLRGLAVAGATRSKQLPDVPTVSESGLPGFEASVWYCLLGPSGLPAEVVAKLNAATNDYLGTAKAQDLFEKLGVSPGGGTPAAVKAFIAQEVERWGPVVKAAKIAF
jgi:tripartite-type tricarboxylate transporter receptor subunit TctC